MASTLLKTKTQPAIKIGSLEIIGESKDNVDGANYCHGLVACPHVPLKEVGIHSLPSVELRQGLYFWREIVFSTYFNAYAQFGQSAYGL